MKQTHIRASMLFVLASLVFSGCGQTKPTKDAVPAQAPVAIQEQTTDAQDITDSSPLYSDDALIADQVDYINEELGVRLRIPDQFEVGEGSSETTMGTIGQFYSIHLSENENSALTLVAVSDDFRIGFSEGSVPFADAQRIDMSSAAAFTDAAQDAFFLDENNMFAVRQENENQMHFFSIEGYGERYLAYNALFRYPSVDGTYAYLRLRSAPIVHTETHLGKITEDGSNKPVDPQQIAIDLVQNRDVPHRQDMFDQFLQMTDSLEFIQ